MARQRFSNIDTVMLRVDNPAQPNVGTGVTILGAPIDVAWFRASIKARMLRFRRFRQRVVQPRLPGGHLYWEDDPDFDLNYHLKPATLPPPGDQAALQDLVSLLASTPLDLDRPLWQVHLVESYGSGCALVWRVHHSLADGVALMHVVLSLMDSDPDASPPSPQPKVPSRSKPDAMRSGGKSGRRAATGLAKVGKGMLAERPRASDLLELGKKASYAVANLVLSPPDSDTALKGKATEPKRAAWSGPIPLDDIKTIRHRMSGTVNDVLLTALTGALGRYLEARGESPLEAHMHALVPISLRADGTEGELGNRIGIILLSLPVHIADPVDRLRDLRKRMDAHKDSLEAPLVFVAMQTFGRAPASVVRPAVDYLCARATAVVTNVKGPQQQLYLAGAPVKAFMFWIPRYGDIGVGVSILSYAGEVRVGVISDRDIVPDPEVIVAGFHAELDALLALAREDLSATGELPAGLYGAPIKLDGQYSGDAG